ncbi:glycosyltransferase family 2 protein [Streptacidiphilus sp. PAMC 29251]
MPPPDVTVITPVHDTRDYLGPWFTSLLDQTMPRDRFEVIALNDGSTDGSAQVLDELAHDWPELLQVVHLPPSGGPARPRNLGLELANGRYVFFLDSDDRLGPETLARLTAYADRLGSDVVLGRIVGINGRRVPRDVFRHNRGQADIKSSGILYALTPAKLFRRELLDQHRIRFRTELRIGSDHPFVVESYLRARRVSVLADYPCYYLEARDGGGNISLGPAVTSSLRLPYMRASAETVLRVDGPGKILDALLRRVLRIEFTDLLGPGFTALPPSAQRTEMAGLRAYLDDWYRAELSRSLPSWVRWRIHCVQEGKRSALCALIATEKADGLGFRADDSGSAAPVLVSEGHAYANLPGFRDPAFGIPDSCYDITAELAVDHRLGEVALDRDGLTLAGTVGLPRLAGPPSAVEVFARERGGGAVVPLSTEHLNGGFRARWAADGMARPGTWDLFAEVCCQGVRREVRLGSSRDPGLTLPSPCYWTAPYGNLSLRVEAPPAVAAVPLPRPQAAQPAPAPRGLRRLRPGRAGSGAAAPGAAGAAPGAAG